MGTTRKLWIMLSMLVAFGCAKSSDQAPEGAAPRSGETLVVKDSSTGQSDTVGLWTYNFLGAPNSEYEIRASGDGQVGLRREMALADGSGTSISKGVANAEGLLSFGVASTALSVILTKLPERDSASLNLKDFEAGETIYAFDGKIFKVPLRGDALKNGLNGALKVAMSACGVMGGDVTNCIAQAMKSTDPKAPISVADSTVAKPEGDNKTPDNTQNEATKQTAGVPAIESLLDKVLDLAANPLESSNAVNESSQQNGGDDNPNIAVSDSPSNTAGNDTSSVSEQSAPDQQGNSPGNTPSDPPLDNTSEPDVLDPIPDNGDPESEVATVPTATPTTTSPTVSEGGQQQEIATLDPEKPEVDSNVSKHNKVKMQKKQHAKAQKRLKLAKAALEQAAKACLKQVQSLHCKKLPVSAEKLSKALKKLSKKAH